MSSEGSPATFMGDRARQYKTIGLAPRFTRGHEPAHCAGFTPVRPCSRQPAAVSAWERRLPGLLSRVPAYRKARCSAPRQAKSAEGVFRLSSCSGSGKIYVHRNLFRWDKTPRPTAAPNQKKRKCARDALRGCRRSGRFRSRARHRHGPRAKPHVELLAPTSWACPVKTHERLWPRPRSSRPRPLATRATPSGDKFKDEVRDGQTPRQC